MKKHKKRSLILATAAAMIFAASITSCKKNNLVQEKTPVLTATTSAAKRTVQGVFSANYASLNVAGMTFTDWLNYMGAIHNEYQKTTLQQLVNEHAVIANLAVFVNNVKNKTIAFFAAKGIAIPPNAYEQGLGNRINSPINPNNYSADGYQIINDLNAILNQPDVVNDPDLIT